VIEENRFSQQGKASCGLARQYTGSAARITNCQIGVFRGLRFAPRSCFIDRALYLPKEWTDDPDSSGIPHTWPPNSGFGDQTKACDENERTRPSRGCPIRVGCWRTGLAVAHIEQQVRQQQGWCSEPAASFFPGLGKRRSGRGAAADIARTRRGSTGRAGRKGAGTKDRGLHGGAISIGRSGSRRNQTM